MATNNIQAVIVDYGGVLMRTVNPAPRRELDWRYGLEPGGAEKAVFGSSLIDAVQLGRVSSAEFWADVGHQMGLSDEELTEFRQTFRSGDRLDEELVVLIRHLRDAGYRTALLSNAPASLHERLEPLGVADAFDVIVISGCEGMMKPDPAIFERTLARVGVPAEEAVFVDDWRVNVAAARQVGLRAIRFNGLAPLRKQLRELGMPVPDPVLAPLPDIRAVIFDWGGVMEELTGDDHTAEWERRLALEPGTLREILWGETWRKLSVSAITNDEYNQYVADQLGFPDAEAIDDFTDEFYAGDRFNPEVLAAVRGLRGRYKVALLSNAWPGQYDVIREKFGIDVCDEFDIYINSADVGLRKPDPAIFHLALERLGVAPQQAIFLDDLLRNVDSARELGIHTVQFVDPATSLAELEALLGHSIQPVIPSDRRESRNLSRPNVDRFLDSTPLRSVPLGMTTIKSRAYRGEKDYQRVRDFLVETYGITRLHHNWCIERWDYWRYFVKPLLAELKGGQPWNGTDIRLWETEEGQLVGVAHPEDPGQAFLQIHPDYRHLEDEMAAWAEQHLAVPTKDGKSRVLNLWGYDYDAERHAVLARRGYQGPVHIGYKRRRAMDKPIPEVEIPEGYTVQSLRANNDLKLRCAVSSAAFGPPAMSTEVYRSLQTAPAYRLDHDLVAVAPDGAFVSFCIVWFDAVNRIGMFEPVGTHSDHRQRGLGKAVMCEGLRRLAALGATIAYVGVGGDNVAANRLYESVGFTEFDRECRWQKEL
jgi:mycothiol synthase